MGACLAGIGRHPPFHKRNFSLTRSLQLFHVWGVVVVVVAALFWVGFFLQGLINVQMSTCRDAKGLKAVAIGIRTTFRFLIQPRSARQSAVRVGLLVHLYGKRSHNAGQNVPRTNTHKTVTLFLKNQKLGRGGVGWGGCFATN